ncbi:MAG: T9SS type A sorting domain-containing protein [Bacteroidota bacterium]
MKHLIILFISAILFLFSCGPSAEEKVKMMMGCMADEIAMEKSIRENLKSTFDAPFPKRNRNLSKILGDTLQIEGRCFPLTFKISSTRKYNCIINIETGDTLFKGTVCKFRTLYYFSEQINDSSYRIFALKVTDSLIYGLQNYFQYAQIDSAIEQGKYTKLVKFTDKQKNIIRLHPDKRELRKLYTSILANTKPFEIIRASANFKASDVEDVSAPIEADDFEILAKVYPNPATDIVNVELHQKDILTPYYLSDLTGKVLMEGELHEILNPIDISHLAKGIYILTVVTPEKQTETIRIIKTK